ncbi:MAG: hypothetical protein U0V74_02230 [Chitinophagales bacterium]
MNDLIGQWHLLYSTFPMWQKHKVHEVTFNYAVTTLNGKPALTDEVKYMKGNTAKSIKGIDTAIDGLSDTYRWRGKGILRLLSSTWKIEWKNSERDCLVLSFEKTFFTLAGLDIICRNKNSQWQAQQAIAHVSKQERFAVYLPELKLVA